MLDFRWHRRSKDRTPIIRDIDIIRFTEEVLSDFKPELLDKPGKLDYNHFIERYLGATIDYQDIYYPDEGNIAGATIFNRDYIDVYDKEHRTVKSIAVEPDTIIIDNSVANSKFFGFEAFTAMHEGGHFQMHTEVYKRASNQISLYSMGIIEPETSGMLCKRSNIGKSKTPLVTNEDFREHQANTYAASMLMPRRTFIPYVYEQNLKDGYGSGIHTILPEFDKHGEESLKYLAAAASRLFGVSRSAVRVNMQKYGLLCKAEEFREAKQRLAYYTSF